MNTIITKNLAERKLDVIRAFNAPVEKVWKAWTMAEILDQWWAPRPWRTETKSLEFKAGGMWLYSMVSPEGERHWCRVDIISVNEGQGFVADATFCDEDGNINPDFPVMHWNVSFHAIATGSEVKVTLSFDTEVGMEQIITMGFEGGFTMALGNLDEVLAA